MFSKKFSFVLSLLLFVSGASVVGANPLGDDEKMYPNGRKIEEKITRSATDWQEEFLEAQKIWGQLTSDSFLQLVNLGRQNEDAQKLDGVLFLLGQQSNVERFLNLLPIFWREKMVENMRFDWARNNLERLAEWLSFLVMDSQNAMVFEDGRLKCDPVDLESFQGRMPTLGLQDCENLLRLRTQAFNALEELYEFEEDTLEGFFLGQNDSSQHSEEEDLRSLKDKFQDGFQDIWDSRYRAGWEQAPDMFEEIIEEVVRHMVEWRESRQRMTDISQAEREGEEVREGSEYSSQEKGAKSFAKYTELLEKNASELREVYNFLSSKGDARAFIKNLLETNGLSYILDEQEADSGKAEQAATLLVCDAENKDSDSKKFDSSAGILDQIGAAKDEAIEKLFPTTQGQVGPVVSEEDKSDSKSDSSAGILDQIGAAKDEVIESLFPTTQGQVGPVVSEEDKSDSKSDSEKFDSEKFDSSAGILDQIGEAKDEAIEKLFPTTQGQVVQEDESKTASIPEKVVLEESNNYASNAKDMGEEGRSQFVFDLEDESVSMPATLKDSPRALEEDLSPPFEADHASQTPKEE